MKLLIKHALAVVLHEFHLAMAFIFGKDTIV